jgi:hypothetical protein
MRIFLKPSAATIKIKKALKKGLENNISKPLPQRKNL